MKRLLFLPALFSLPWFLFISPAAAGEESKGEGSAVPLFAFESEDGDFALQIGGFTFLNYYTFDSGVDIPLYSGGETRSTFELARARLSFKGRVLGSMDYKFEVDFSNSDSMLKDAYFGGAFCPYSKFRIGMMKAPISSERLLSRRYLDFIERSLPARNLVHSRNVGLLIHGDIGDGIISYNAGLFNPENSLDLPSSGTPEAMGRVALSLLKGAGKGKLGDLKTGLSAGYTYRKGNDLEKVYSFSGKTDEGFLFFSPLEVGGARMRAEWDLKYTFRFISLYAEFDYVLEEREGVSLEVDTDGDGVTDDTKVEDRPGLEITGFNIAITALLTGEEKREHIVPKRRFSLGRASFGPGALELALRYHSIDFNADPFNFPEENAWGRYPAEVNQVSSSLGRAGVDERVQGVTAGLNWYFNEFMKFQFNSGYYLFDDSILTPVGKKDMLNFSALFGLVF